MATVVGPVASRAADQADEPQASEIASSYLTWNIKRLQFLKEQKKRGAIPSGVIISDEELSQLPEMHRLLRDLKANPEKVLVEDGNLMKKAREHHAHASSGPIEIKVTRRKSRAGGYKEDPNIARALGRVPEMRFPEGPSLGVEVINRDRKAVTATLVVNFDYKGDDDERVPPPGGDWRGLSTREVLSLGPYATAYVSVSAERRQVAEIWVSRIDFEKGKPWVQTFQDARKTPHGISRVDIER